MTIKILPNDNGRPKDKLADVELHFSSGPLNGIKLVGISIWKGPPDRPIVRLPQREYISSEGIKRNFSHLRPIADPTSTRRLTELILEAYDAYVHAETYGAP